TVLVDGTLVEVKIVEEWGYAIREDTCLFEEESGSEEPQSEFGEGHGDPEVRYNVDVMVERIAEGLEKDVGDDLQ
ncbi:DUF4283 domain protein, partial [Trifolium medium]|nr:DUF4283 domain protein [Trifolium medium]